MRHPETIYRGARYPHGGVSVTVNGQTLTTDGITQLLGYRPSGFEWGYRGAGPLRLALALILDATGDAAAAHRAYEWFMGGPVYCWGSSWQITAGEIHRWLAQHERECRAESGGEVDLDDCFEVAADPEQRSEYHGDLQCPRCSRIAAPVEWPTKGGIRHCPVCATKRGIRHCPVCATKRGPVLIPVPLAFGPAREGGAA